MVYNCTKFHENILNGISVMERTDGRTDGGHDIIRPVFDGRIKMMEEESRAVELAMERHILVYFWFVLYRKYVSITVRYLY